MWQPTSTLVFFILCLNWSSVFNGAEAVESEAQFARAFEWDCASNDDCTINNSSCVDGYCGCNDGYIYNNDLTACLLSATAYGDECTETIQCSAYLLSGSVCDDGICICNQGYHYTHGRCYASSGLGEACVSDAHCYVWADNEASSCVDGICVCSDGFYAREYRTCRRGSYAVGESCGIDLDCQFENSYCDTSSFYGNSYVCALNDTNATRTSNGGEVYETVDESLVTRSFSRADENATVGAECVSDDDCASLEHSKCGSTGTCICNRAYFASDDLSICIAEMGEDCASEDEEIISNSICRDGIWSCGYSTVASINQQICRKSTKNYNYSCLHDEQCFVFGPDASCQDQRCLCNEGSHLVEDLKFCWISKGISESCQADEDCYVADLGLELSCTNSICTCPNGTSPNYNNTLCKDDNAALGDICEEDVDCSTTNAICSGSVCSCPENYIQGEDSCDPGINAPCSSDSDCTVENSACGEEQICECAENYVSDEANSCRRLSAYGEECQSDIQCSTVLSNTYCAVITSTSNDDSNSIETSVCQCESDYHYRFGICYVKTAIGESCTTLGDCYVESGIEDVVCRKGVCACSWDSSENSTSCSRVSSNATTFFLSTWISFILFSVKIFLT